MPAVKIAPEAPSGPGELELLIREARDRQRRRRIAAVAIVAAVAGAALAAWAAIPGSRAEARSRSGSEGATASSRRCPSGNLGTIAFLRRSELELLDLRSCRVRTLVTSGVHAGPGIAMSADGRWVGFWRGYVATNGGPVHRLPGVPVWAPQADVFAVSTKQGGLELGRPDGPLHRVVPDGWGASPAAFSPDGRRLAVSRTADRGHVEEVWLLDLATGARQELFRERRREGAPLLLQGFSPDGRWLLFWKDLYASESILADGVPLLAVPTAGGRPRPVTGELHYSDYLSWCGGSLSFVLNRQGRFVTQGDGLARTRPPLWRTETILPARGPTSWGAFSCGPTGTIAIAAGPSTNGEPFGREHRSIWLVRGGRASVLPETRPPRRTSDEWPSWSADGRWLLFVRTRWNGHGWPGTLYAVDLATKKLIGPIARVGATENYYGHYGWSSQLAWHRP